MENDQVNNQLMREISHCYVCKFGGCGWKIDDVPYWFCGFECINEYLRNKGLDEIEISNDEEGEDL